MRNLNDLLAQDKKAKQFFLTLSEDVQGSLIQNTNQIHNADELYFHAEQVMGQKEKGNPSSGEDKQNPPTALAFGGFCLLEEQSENTKCIFER